MDLFTPVVDETLQHRNFQRLCANQNSYDGDVLNDWARGFVDRDGKFVAEFQRTFDTCFWELYLFAVLKQYGLAVDFSHGSPDFCVTGHGGFNMEATVALHAKGTVPEYEKPGQPIPQDLNDFNRRTIIRIGNSVDNKQKKFLDSYAALPHVRSRPFVLAITAIDGPHARLACQRAIEAVLFGYYVDEERYLREGGELKGHQIECVLKDNGSPVDLDILLKEEFRWLSAVVFSSCASWGKVRALSSDPNPDVYFETVRYNSSGIAPLHARTRKSQYVERLGEGLGIFHNPQAEFPLDPSIFRHRDVFQAYFAEANGEWVCERRDGQLLFRQVFTTVARG
ncbi:glycosaminoglycan attachment site [Bradyrhizobium elkanii]|uniref:Glycosaminoglycan attachment site n=1 Tax=Bradyrhizobium elkanii TaxID=29448 RepID=A0A4U6S0C9_BRAEL|nr:glycosaminoglycan attachment site [Bradyrhizobium elkanii]TKV80133.1 glycosaminoglycan attachment site [Bradyrhizobium elkanii]